MKNLFAPDTHAALHLGDDWIVPVLAEPEDEWFRAFGPTVPLREGSERGGSGVGEGSGREGSTEVPRAVLGDESAPEWAVDQRLPLAFTVAEGWAMFAISLRAIARCVGGEGRPMQVGGSFSWEFDSGTENSV